MVRLTCLLRRKEGLTPAEFHVAWCVIDCRSWRTRVAATSCATSSTPARSNYYTGDGDPGFDGVTVQWFESMDVYRAHMTEPDFGEIWADIERFPRPTVSTSW